MGQRIGRTPWWPGYYSKTKPQKRTLAFMRGDTIYVENETALTATTYRDFVYLLFHKNLLVFVESLTDPSSFPWLRESIYAALYDGTSVMSNKDGHPLAIRYSGERGQSRWVVPCETWDTTYHTEFLHDMRVLYTLVGVVKPTPGSLGREILKGTLQALGRTRYTAPCTCCLEFIRAHSVGGRCDTIKTGYVGDVLELDEASGYLAHFLELPSGTSKRFLFNHCSQFATYFAKCTVTIREELALGPFPIRLKKSKVSYPTLPGRYEAYLWKEQISDCIKAGLRVDIDGGYGWSHLTSDTLDYCRRMYHYRVSSQHDYIDDFIKKVTVSSIGSFGMRNTFFTVVPYEFSRQEERCLLDDDFLPLNYVVREEHDYTRASMLHWYQYTLMQCARTLYKMALPYAKEGRLVMTNYDAIIVYETDERHRYLEKHTLSSKKAQLGDWRWQALTNTTVHGPRSLTCDQKDTRPGVLIQGR